VRLDVPDDRKSDLHATNDLFQYSANRTAEWAWRYPDEDYVTSKSEAEAAIYDELRHQTDGLHATSFRKLSNVPPTILAIVLTGLQTVRTPVNLSMTRSVSSTTSEQPPTTGTE
jgi:hypothetical protein